jgi:hypothetical protein
MAAFFSHTWFVWWGVAVVVLLRWLHVIAPDHAFDATQPDPLDEEFEYFSEYVHFPQRWS